MFLSVAGKDVGEITSIQAGSDPATVMVRTHHAWLHPTKGWRNFARPRGTNKRRKLILQGALMVKNSNARTRNWRRFNPCRHQSPD